MKSKLFLLLALTLTIFVLGKPAYAADGPLFRDATLRGRVTDTAGNPVEGVAISLRVVDGQPNPNSYPPTTYSDANGNFAMTNLVPNTYVAHLSDYQERYAITYYPGTLVPSHATRLTLRNDEVITINPTVTLAGKIVGTVRLGNNTPLSSMTVNAYRHVDGTGWVKFASDYTYDGDQFTLGGLPNGPYRLQASGYRRVDDQGLSYDEYYGGEKQISGGWDVMVNGSDTTTITWVMRDTTVRLSGRAVSESGLPLAGIRVRVYRFNAGALPGEEWMYPLIYTQTDANGDYSTLLTQTGQYKVAFIDWSEQYTTVYNGNMPTLGGAPIITITDEDVSGVDVTMNSGGSIRGQVVAVDGSADFNHFSINLYRWNEHDAFLHVNNYQLDRDRQGNFTISTLTPGQYRLKIDVNLYANVGYGFWYGGGNTLSEATSFTIGLGETADVGQFVAAQDSGVLQGQIVDVATNRPIVTSRVSLYGNNNIWMGSSAVDGNGRFRMPYLPAGSYDLYVYDDGSKYVDSYQSSEPLGTFIIEPNKTTNANVKLARGGEINGRVFNSIQLDYRSASAYTLVDGQWVYAGGTGINSDGWYKIGALPTGEYIVRFSGSSPCCENYLIAEEYYGDVTDEDAATVITVELGGYVNGIDATLGNHVSDGDSYFDPQGYGSISGQLTDENGQPIANAEVFLYRQWSSPRGRTGWSDNTAMTVTDASGNYQFDNIGIGAIYTTGNFRIGFDGAKIGYETKYYGETLSFDSAEIVVLTLDDLHATGIDATLAHIGCQISNCQ